MKKNYFYIEIDVYKKRTNKIIKFDILLKPFKETKYLSKLAEKYIRRKYNGWVTISNKYGVEIETIYF